MFVRKVKNKSGNYSIQIMEKRNGRNRLVKHIGTARNNLELKELVDEARKYLDELRIKSGVISLFDSRFTKTELASLLDQVEVLRVLDSAVYQFFEYFYCLLGFNKLDDECFKDLVISRIIHPVSKAATQDFLQNKFNKYYSLTGIYRCMAKSHQEKYKEVIETEVLNFSLKSIASSISVLFFDVTTLYYEAFDEDDLRKNGFSKDHKQNQPQIVVALTVTKHGFPIHLKVFEGNKFEGHTMLPCIKEILEKHQLKDFVIVADSAMMSQDNLDKLENNNLQFIVGARLGNLSSQLFKKVVNISKTDGCNKRFDLGNGRILVISYSAKRAHKDKSDRVKQIERAKFAVSKQSVVARSYKFLIKANSQSWILNQEKIKKAEMLEGFKGYITNAVHLTNEEILQKYSELWQVEKSFRISKSDLKVRPIFHTVREKIEAHLMIVFASLAISRYVELLTGKSIKRIINVLDQIKEVVIQDKVSKESVSKFIMPGPEAKLLLKTAKIKWVT